MILFKVVNYTQRAIYSQRMRDTRYDQIIYSIYSNLTFCLPPSLSLLFFIFQNSITHNIITTIRKKNLVLPNNPTGGPFLIHFELYSLHSCSRWPCKTTDAPHHNLNRRATSSEIWFSSPPSATPLFQTHNSYPPLASQWKT